MKRFVIFGALVLVSSMFAADDTISRWEKAVGGHDRIAAIKTMYREAAIQYGPYTGTLKVWHTSDGKYRKEEQIATHSIVETFDGNVGAVQQGADAARPMTPAETQLVKTRRFANSNAMFFVFFPERHRGTRKTEGDGTIVFVPDGGVEWRVTLDPQTSLPKVLVHQEADRTITVTVLSYETVDGVQFEKEIQRAGAQGAASSLRFTKTVVNPAIDPALFRLDVANNK